MTVRIGIEKLRVYPCSMVLDMATLCEARGQDPQHIRETLLVDQRSVNPPYEDPVTMAVNAAMPMLSEQDRQSIELLVVATESGVDQEKPISAWVHRYLGLTPHCRNYEIKHACYGGTAALQAAIGWIASGLAGDAKALVITTDQSRMHLGKPYEFVLGAGAVAVLVSNTPRLFEVEIGKTGYFANEVNDLTRPTSRVETGNEETSLLSYLEALEGAYDHYLERVGEAIDFDAYFQNLIYHVPFGGITFLAHKALLRRYGVTRKADARAHFERKSLPALRYARRMGGTLSSSTFIALLGLLDAEEAPRPGDRVGIFSYGSGSCAEFYSGLVGEDAREVAREANLPALLDARRVLSVSEYEEVERARTRAIDRGDYRTSFEGFDDWYERAYRGAGRLVFRGPREYFREYAWS